MAGECRGDGSGEEMRGVRVLEGRMTPHSETNVPQESSDLRRCFLRLVTMATQHCSLCVCMCFGYSACLLDIKTAPPWQHIGPSPSM